MKKQIKRTVSVLLSLLMIVGLFLIVHIEVGAAGNSFSLATNYYFGNNASGSTTQSNKQDYYKFSLSSSGAINLNLIAYFDYVNLHIYDTSFKEVWTSNPEKWNSTTKSFSLSESFDLTSGTYYFLVECTDHWSYNNQNPYGSYSFKFVFSSAGESFSESKDGLNNTYNVANRINLNTNYKGQIAINDKCDIYKFDLSNSTKINISLIAYFDYINLHIFNSSYIELWKTDPRKWNSTTKVMSLSESVVLSSGTYYFLVECTDHWSYLNQEKPYGNYNFTLSTPQPAKPSAPTISVANGVSGLDVAWGKVANAQSYVVYYKTASSGWSSFSTSSTRATITNVQSGKMYYVQVQSIGANGVKGNYSAVKSMTYLSRAAITSLTYNGNNTLKWNAVPGANKYQIARLRSGDKAYTYLYTTTPSLTEKNAIGGIAYTYQVRAMYQTANSGTAYGAWSASKSVPTLVAPTVTLANKSNGIRVTWNSIRGAIRYIVYYKKSTDKNWSSAVTTNLYYPILKTNRGATYYVQVRPVGSTVSTPYSSVKSIVYK